MKRNARLWALGLSVLMAAGQVQMPVYAARIPGETQLVSETAATESEAEEETESADEIAETELTQETVDETVAEEITETVIPETEAAESETTETVSEEITETAAAETAEEVMLDANGKALKVGDNQLTVTEEGTYFAFKAPKTADYKIYYPDAVNSVAVDICNSDKLMTGAFEWDEDTGNKYALLSVNKGETYYLYAYDTFKNINFRIDEVSVIDISFYANGGEVYGSDSDFIYAVKGEPLCRYSTIPSAYRDEPWLFKGWSTKKDGSGKCYSEEELKKLSLNADTTFYAIWEKGITLTFNGNGGLFIDNMKSVKMIAEKGSSLADMNYPAYAYMEVRSLAHSDKHKTFAGWNTNANGTGTSYTMDEIRTLPLNKDLTVYAQWTSCCFITYKANSSEYDDDYFDTLDQKVVKNSCMVRLPDCDDRCFMGWNTQANGKGTAYSPMELMNLKITKDLTVYAQWKKAVKVTFMDDGEQIDEAKVPVGETILNPADYDDYTSLNMVGGKPGFCGWNTKANGKGTMYTPQDLAAFRPTANMTLYAQYTKSFLTVTLDANGGNFPEEIDGAEIKTVSSVKLKLAKGNSLHYMYYGTGDGETEYAVDRRYWKPGSDGRLIVGWNTKKDGSGTAYSLDAFEKLVPTKDITLYAKWAKSCKVTLITEYGTFFNDSYKIDYYAPNGKFANVVSEEYDIPYFPFNVPPVGRAFAGWNTKADGSGTYYMDLKSFSTKKDITLYAIWSKDICKLKLVIPEGMYEGYDPDGQQLSGGVAEHIYTVLTAKGRPAGNFMFPEGIPEHVNYNQFFIWNTKRDGSGRNYTDAEARKLVMKSDLTLYAQWKNDKYAFSDVLDPNAYYYTPVYWAAGKGITVGYGGPNRFSPNATCTRAQIVTFLWRLKGEPKAKTHKAFTDVKSGEWYYEAISWAAENNITVGLNDGTGRFGINLPCTREQCVTFLYRAAGNPKPASMASFTDVNPKSYFYNAVSWAASNKITVGLNDGTGRFGVGGLCTRAMIVTFLYRYANL